MIQSLSVEDSSLSLIVGLLIARKTFSYRHSPNTFVLFLNQFVLFFIYFSVSLFLFQYSLIYCPLFWCAHRCFVFLVLDEQLFLQSGFPVVPFTGAILSSNFPTTSCHVEPNNKIPCCLTLGLNITTDGPWQSCLTSNNHICLFSFAFNII